MNSVRKGNACENRVAGYLEQRGWLVGKRRHQKGGGDLVAIKPGYKVRLIECKATREPWSHFRPAERAELLETAKRYDADAVLALSPGAGIPQFVPEKDWPEGG